MWEPGNVFTVVQNADTRESAQSKDVFNKYISGLTIGDQSVSDILKSSIPGDIQIPLVFEDLPDVRRLLGWITNHYISFIPLTFHLPVP